MKVTTTVSQELTLELDMYKLMTDILASELPYPQEVYQKKEGYYRRYFVSAGLHTQEVEVAITQERYEYITALRTLQNYARNKQKTQIWNQQY